MERSLRFLDYARDDKRGLYPILLNRFSFQRTDDSLASLAIPIRIHRLAHLIISLRIIQQRRNLRYDQIVIRTHQMHCTVLQNLFIGWDRFLSPTPLPPQRSSSARLPPKGRKKELLQAHSSAKIGVNHYFIEIGFLYL